MTWRRTLGLGILSLVAAPRQTMLTAPAGSPIVHRGKNSYIRFQLTRPSTTRYERFIFIDSLIKRAHNRSLETRSLGLELWSGSGGVDRLKYMYHWTPS